MWMPRCGPDFFETPQILIEQSDWRVQVRHRRHAANREARLGLDEIGIGPADLAHQGCNFFLVHTAVSRGDHQHGHAVFLASENHALGNLTQLYTQAAS